MLTDKEQKRLALEAIERIEGTCQTLRSLLGEETPTSKPQIGAGVAKPSGSPKPKRSHSTSARKAKYAIAESLPATSLGPLPDITSEDWPFAIQPHPIVSSGADDAEKQFRALQVVGVLGLDFTDTTTLDFGCGEGHVAKEIATRATKVVGYDLKNDNGWDGKISDSADKLLLTSDDAQIERNGPYDRIILYDVLDHLEGLNPLEVLDRLKALLAPGGKIFCRCHPWTAKHGGHLYEKLNKAYVHLALTPDELVQAGYAPDYNLKLIKPLAAYNNWFDLAGLKIEDRKVTQDPVPEYLHGPLLERITKVTWGAKIEPEQALKIMSNQFIDYLVTI